MEDRCILRYFRGGLKHFIGKGPYENGTEGVGVE